jgi:maltooligosyltrehalose trehalohydrolase
MLRLYRDLIALRRNRPELSDPRLDRFEVRGEDSWLVLHRGALRLACNLGDAAVDVPLDGTADEVLLSWGDGIATGSVGTLPAESFVLLSVK